MHALIKISKKNLKSLKRVFLEKSQKSAILTKNGQKSIFFPKKETHTQSSVFFLLNLTIFNENKPFWIILEHFSSAHLGFSVIGHCGQNHKKADLGLKKNFFQIFWSRFGFLVQFYPYP
jgi:hypothetical protein